MVPLYSNRQRGFSLLEVLVAFSILAISLGVLLQVFSSGVRGAALSDDYSYAALLAEAKLAAVGATIPLKPGERSGELEEEGYRWTLTITRYEEGKNSWQLPVKPYKVEVVVSWTEAARERKVSLSTLRLSEPAISRPSRR